MASDTQKDTQPMYIPTIPIVGIRSMDTSILVTEPQRVDSISGAFSPSPRK